MGILDLVLQRKFQEEDRAKVQKQVQGLIGQAPSPEYAQMSQEGIPVEQYIKQSPMDVRAGSGAMESGQLDIQKLARGLLAVPETQGIGSQLIMQTLPSAQKPTGLMQNIAAAGLQPGTPEYQAAIMEAVMRPETQISLGPKSIPIADLMKMRMPDGSRPPVGMTYDQAQAAGVSLQKDVGGDSASKLAMLDTATAEIPGMEAMIFKNGGINRSLIKQAWGIGVAEPVAGLVSPEAGKLFAGFEYGIQAITRAETGAAMPASEIDNTRKRFMPKPWDSDEVVGQKWNAYKLFINNASKYIDPKAAKSGQWDKAINYDALMNDAKGGKKDSGLIGGPKAKTVRFEDL